MLWRTLGALLLGAVVAVVVANAVMALGSDEGPRPPGAIELTPNPGEAADPEEPGWPAGPGDDEPAVVIPPPVHLDPLPAAEPTTPPPPPPPPPAPTAPAPAPAPPPDADDDDADDDDADDDDGDADDLDDDGDDDD
ncbi:hypothetical protein NHL50_17605 [Acidimicrobiia bacterium EGI L10123]|uniref:hypothetical protein n=1 Tax=Salinilacustrithrix flava TaxID=2957203 RepID=UPI003D7C16EB|nr:hypothetical protein [Acidimicrobiia bacterium EGI L10123]